MKGIFSSEMRALLRKEFLETWRDRRALLTAIAFSLMFPVMVAGVSFFIVKTQMEETTRLALLGGDEVPALVQQLRSAQLQVDVLSEGEPRALLQRDYDLVLQLGEGFAEDYRNFRAPKLYLYVDSASGSAGNAEKVLQQRLGSLQQMVVSQRLTARGVAPQLLAPWQLQVRDVSTPSSRGALLFATVPGLLIMALFISGLASSVDTSAGERERLSLETLLLQPLPRWQLVLTKALAVASMSWFGAALAVSALVAVMPFIPLAELGIQQATSFSGVVTMMLALLPLALLVAVVQIMLALRSSSFKDAQTQLSILQIAPVILLMVMDVSRVELGEPFWQLVPIVGQQQWLKALLVGETVPPLLMLAGSVVTLLVAALVIALGARALGRERLLAAV